MTSMAAPPVAYLASYPKSGNTWFRAVYEAVLANRPVDINRLEHSSSGALRDTIDRVLGVPTSDLTDDEVLDLRSAAETGLVTGPASVLVGPLRKLHDRLRLRADGPAVVPAGARVVYLVRDPRDVAVSFSRHLGTSLETTVARLADPAGDLDRPGGGIDVQVRQVPGSWSDHVRSWLDDDEVQVHLVRYEDLHDDPVATFGTALHACDLEVTDEDVAGAVAATSFDRLHAQERDAGFVERRPRSTAPFFRRGCAGSWREELPSHLAARVEADHHDVMERLGYRPSDAPRTQIPPSTAGVPPPAHHGGTP